MQAHPRVSAIPTIASGTDLVSGAPYATRKPTGRWCRCRVAGQAGEGSFEAGEEVDDVGCFEDPVTLSPDVALAKNSGCFETVDGFWSPARFG